MSDLPIHPITSGHVAAFQESPTHALLLAGPEGSGKLALAIRLAETILSLEHGGFSGYGYGMIVRADKGKAIGIDAVRELEHFLSLKVPSKEAYNRVVIIESAHLLTVEAQNALLKTLEEPAQGSIIILTASHTQALLPTVDSRVRTIQVYSPNQAELEAYFSGRGYDTADVSRAFSISGGLPGMMDAILSRTDHPLMAAAQKARELLSQPTYARLLSIDELSKDRAQARGVVSMLLQMSHMALRTAKGSSAGKWQQIQQAAYDADKALAGSAQPKLVLMSLVLQF